MRKFTLCLAAALISSAQALWSQGPPIGPTDTLKTRKENVFSRVRADHYRHYTPDSARAEKMYGRWENFWKGRIYYTAPTEERMFTTYNQLLKGFFEPREPYQEPDNTNGDPKIPNLSNTQFQRCVASYPANWKYDGPHFNNYGARWEQDNSGHAAYLWVNPTNKNHILLGSFASGIWETQNEGRNWSNITDNSTGYTWGPIGVARIAVSPKNLDVQYFSTDYRKTTAGLGNFYGYSRGIFFRNAPNGQFLPDLAFRERMKADGHFIGNERFDVVPKYIEFTDTGNLYVTYNRNIYRRSSFANNIGNKDLWTPIPMNASIPANYQIITGAVSHLNPGKMAFLTNIVDSTMYLITYDENTPGLNAVVTAINNPHCPPVDANWMHRFNDQGVRNMEFAYDNNDLYFTFSVGENYKHFYRINNIFTSPSLEFISELKPLGSSRQDLYVFKMHPKVHNLIYFGNIQGGSPVKFSMDRGQTIRIMDGNPPSWLINNNYLHADLRHMVLYNTDTMFNGAGDEIYIATDGGISKKAAGNNYFESLTGAGLNMTLCYDLSVSQTNTAFTVFGAQDTGGGIKMKKSNGASQWYWMTAGGDGLMTAISRNGYDYFAGNNQDAISTYGRLDIDTFYKTGNPDAPVNDPVTGSWERPTKFDRDNNLLHAVRYIWQNPKSNLQNSNISATDWDRYWGNEPVDVTNSGDPNGPAAPYKNNDSLGKYKKPLEFYKAEADQETGYLANYNWGNAENQSSHESALLYFTENGGATWRNISPPTSLVQGYIPRHIEMDQKNPQRVWMALGLQGDSALWNQTPAQRTKRVLYCADARIAPPIWQDISKGLPPLPINRLVYQQGSDDVIFAGTDGGVFRWNKADQQWECFMDGMPHTVVTDLEIQYCTGKLKAATYGRGIWETELEPNMNSFNHTAPYYEEISGVQNWSEDRSVMGGIRVTSGATFTISGCTVYMPRNAKIHLEQGATLILENGALLTNDCDESMWGGIEMYGNNNNSQALVSNQSKVIIRDNSTIRHARIGIADYSAEYWNSGGGIIDIDGANFENCYRALAFNDYPKFNNSSKVVNARIWVDNAYKLSSASSRDFITVFNENGILIDKCTLEDKRTFDANTIYADKLFNGIFVFRGGINAKRNLFKRLTSGVKNDADIITASFNTVIDLNTFTDVKEAITQGGNYTDVKNNTISGMAASFFGNSPTTQITGKVTGIYLDGPVLAYVHNNGMVYTPSLVAKYGVVSNGTKFQNLIRMTDNRVDRAFAGIQTQRYNRYLQTLCNALNANVYAFSVNPQSPNGDFAHQGQGFGSTDWRPRNNFNSNSNDVYFNINTSSSLIPAKYYVKSTSGTSPKIPSIITGPYAGNFDVEIDNTSDDVSCYYDDGSVTMVGRMPAGVISVNGAIIELNGLAISGQRLSARAVELYSFIIDTLYRSTDPLSYSNDLVTFLKYDKEDISRHLLIGHYHIHNDSVLVNTYIDSLQDLSPDDKQAYADYLAMQRHLTGTYGSPLAIPFDSLETSVYYIENFSEREDFIGDLARNWVRSFGQGIRNERYIEEIFEGGEGANQFGNGLPEPKKLMVSPNPANTHLTITVLLPEAQKGAIRRIEIVNALGKLVYQQNIKEISESMEVNVEGWVPGIYNITLYQNGKVVSTERVSVIK